MSSFTSTETMTFTVTHAKHMATKVSADLKRMQRFYGDPSDEDIALYEGEVIELLKAGYLGTLTVGYVRNNQWIEPTLRYTARSLFGMATGDDDPGRVVPGCNILGATFTNYLIYSPEWNALSESAQVAFKSRLPFQRTGAQEPTVNGYLVEDKTYSAGDRALSRSSVKGY